MDNLDLMSDLLDTAFVAPPTGNIMDTGTSRCISPDLANRGKGAVKLETHLENGKLILDNILYTEPGFSDTEEEYPIPTRHDILPSAQFEKYAEEIRLKNPSSRKIADFQDKAKKVGELREKMINQNGWPDHCKNSISVSTEDDHTFNELFVLCRMFDWTQNKFVKSHVRDVPLNRSKTLAGMVMAQFLQQLCGWKNFGVCPRRYKNRNGLPNSTALFYNKKIETLVLRKPRDLDTCQVKRSWFQYFSSFQPDSDTCEFMDKIVTTNIRLYTRAKFVLGFYNIVDTNQLRRVRVLRPHLMQTKMDVTKFRITRCGIVANFLPEMESDIDSLVNTTGKVDSFLVNQLQTSVGIYEKPVEGNPYPRKREIFSFYQPQHDSFVQLVNRHFNTICRYLVHADQTNNAYYKRWHHLVKCDPKFSRDDESSISAYNAMNVESVSLTIPTIPVFDENFELCACVPTKAKFDVHAGINFDASCMGGSLLVGKNILSHCYTSEVTVSAGKTGLFNDVDVNQFLEVSLRRPSVRKVTPVPNTKDRYCNFNPDRYSSFPSMQEATQYSNLTHQRLRPEESPISAPSRLTASQLEMQENTITNQLTGEIYTCSPEKSFLLNDGDPQVYNSVDISEYYDDNIDEPNSNNSNDFNTTNLCPADRESITSILKGTYYGFQFDGSRQFAACKPIIGACNDTEISKIQWSPMFNYSSLIHGSGSFRGNNCYNKNHQSTYWHNMFRGTLEAWGIPSFQSLVQGDIGFEASFSKEIPYTHYLPSFAKFRNGFILTDKKIDKIPLNLGNTLMQNRSMNILTLSRPIESTFTDDLIGSLYDMYTTSHFQNGPYPNIGFDSNLCRPDNDPSSYFSNLVKNTHRDTPDCEELNSHVLGYLLDANIFPILLDLPMDVRHAIMKLLSGILVSTCFNWRIRKRDLDENGYINPAWGIVNAMKFYNYHYWFQMCQSFAVSSLRCQQTFYQVDCDDVVDTLTEQLGMVSIVNTVFLLFYKTQYYPIRDVKFEFHHPFFILF